VVSGCTEHISSSLVIVCNCNANINITGSLSSS